MDHDGKGWAVKADGLWFRSQTPNLVVVWPYAKCFMSLHLNFLPGRKGKMPPFRIAVGYREVKRLEDGLGASSDIGESIFQHILKIGFDVLSVLSLHMEILSCAK